MVELHYHLDGGLRPSTCLDLYKRFYKCEILPSPFNTIENMKKAMSLDKPEFDLSKTLEKFEIPLHILQDSFALERVAYEAVIDLYNDGVDYAEIRFSPQSHMRKGLTQSEAVDAVLAGIARGRKETNNQITVGLILCMMRGGKKEDNLRTINLAREYRGTCVCGVDLAGDEITYPLYMYMGEIELCKQLSIPLTVHAGEVDNKMDLLLALDLGVRRIGHGTVAMKYPELMQMMKEKDVLVECCPTSNYKTGIINSVSNHPIRKFYEYGIKVVACCDDATLMDTTTSKEITICKDRIGMNYLQLNDMERWGEMYRFLK